jgi:uncharacterized membrane protein YqiK
MTLTQLDAELREFYTKNKEGKGSGYGMRAIRQYVNELPLGEKLTKAIEALNECVYALQYAAYNIDESKIEDLPKGIIESTGASHTALIAARNAQQTLTELKQQP